METLQTGFKLATSIISNGAITGTPWTNQNNILLSDGKVAESVPGEASDIIVGNFNPSVPVGATVLGIEIQLLGYEGSQTSPPLSLTLNALDNTTGEDLFYPFTSPITSLTEEEETYVFGNSTYLFGTTWTVDQINNFKLQLLANGDISVDAILMNVIYGVPTPTTPSTPGVGCPDCNSPIQALSFTLALPFYSTDRYAYLESFNYPDPNMTPIEYSDLGACGGAIDFTFDPGLQYQNVGDNFMEDACSGVWTVLENGTVQIDFGSSLQNRGLSFHTPYGSNPNLMSDHDAGSTVIISNSAHFYSRFQRTCVAGSNQIRNEIVAGSVYTFTLANTPANGQVSLFADRTRLYPTTDYSISGNVITTVASYNTGDLLADYNY